jgi:hypothetical protein
VGRGSYALARVAVYVRTAGTVWWWTGVVAAGAGAVIPGLTGRRIGVLAGAAAFVVAGVAAFCARRRRFLGLLHARSTAGKWALLRDRAVTVREWRRAHRWWPALGFVAALGSSVVVPVAGGAVLAGAGAGLWEKAVWIGRWERLHEQLLWVRPEWAAGRGPAGGRVRGWMTTGPLAGDAAEGGVRRPRAARARAVART